MPTRPIKTITEHEALLRLSTLCSRGEHSSGEMRDKMHRWGLSDDASQRVVSTLIEERFVDDERFCRFFVRDKMRFDKWGRRKIEQALYQKGVNSDISQRVLDEVPDDDFVQILRPLLAAKRRSVKAATPYELNGKLIRFALGRGFGMNIIRHVIDTENTDECYDENF